MLKVRKDLVLVSVTFALLVIGLAAISVFGLGRAFGVGSSQLTPDGAIAAVRAIVPSATNLNVSPIQHGPFHPFYTVQSDGVYANVDTVDGSVVSLVIVGASPDSARVAVSPSAAIDAAAQFAKAHSIPNGGLEDSVSLVDHGSASEYDVTWEHRINGALVPNRLTIAVNPATGEVFSMIRLSRPYVDPPNPIVTAEAASSSAATLADMPSAAVVSVDLKVSFDDSGKQLLVWIVSLKGPSNAALVEVDALTGQAQIIGRG